MEPYIDLTIVDSYQNFILAMCINKQGILTIHECE